MTKAYQPYWPETVIFWGAGATRPLNMKTTGELANILLKLSGILDENAQARLRPWINQLFPEIPQQTKDELWALLTVIDADQEAAVEFEKAKRILQFGDKRVKDLKRLYDWQAVKKVIGRCPGVQEGHMNLQDLYNLLDMHIQSQKGLNVNGDFINLDRLIAARRTVDMLTQLIHAMGYQGLCQSQNIRREYLRYYQFAKILAKLMVEEGLERYHSNEYDINDRRFYLFSYAVLSMNWDPLFLWLIFNAHKEINESATRPFIGTPAQPMKLFNDFAHFLAVRKIDTEALGTWFPMNETAVQRLNDPKHITSRRVRIGKFYFPHGCHGFRECPNCGKLTFYLGSHWNICSPDLFPPQIIPSLSPRKGRSKEEEEAINEGKYDAVQCTHCGTITESHHTATVMQTNFKNSYPPFIEEIQRDMRVAIEKADHLIFAGYSLPPDDFIYRSMLAARRKMGKQPVKCSVISYDENGKDEWLKGDKLESFIQNNPNSSFADVCKRVMHIFGKENVRGYAAGFPQVFLQDGQASEERVKRMLSF